MTAVASGGPGAATPGGLRPCRSHAAPALRRTTPSRDASPLSFWLDDPRRPEALPAHTGYDRRRPARGRRRLLRAVDRAARQGGRAVARRAAARGLAHRLGGVGPQRRLLRAVITHGVANGLVALAGRDRAARRLGHENLDELEATLDALRHRLLVRAHRRARRRHRGLPDRGARRAAAPRPRLGEKVEVLDPEQLRALVDSPLYLGGVHDPQRARWSTPHASRGGCATPASRSAFASTRAPAPPASAPRRRRRRGRHRVRRRPGLGPRRPGRPGHQRVPAAAAPRSSTTSCPVYDYVLMTEPLSGEQWDAIGWAGPAGHRRHGQPVPLLPPHRRRPDPVRRLRRDLPRSGMSRDARRAARVVRAARRAPRRGLPAARRHRVTHPGAAPSTPARASRRSSAPPRTAGSRTPPATPASASAPRASAPR